MTDDAYLDGNALAGSLGEVFVAEVTAAHTTCARCGRKARLADLRVFAGGPGMIARCAGCEEVVARVVRTANSMWLDLRGTVALTIPLGED
jgi:hypothetical protein